jgi:hypothetical protein
MVLGMTTSPPPPVYPVIVMEEPSDVKVNCTKVA